MFVYCILWEFFVSIKVIPHGSVVSDSQECSTVGAAIMKKGGSVVDAAITTSFCLAVVQPHLTGLGG